MVVLTLLTMCLHLSQPCQCHTEFQCLEMMLCVLFICIKDGKQRVVQSLPCHVLTCHMMRTVYSVLRTPIGINQRCLDFQIGLRANRYIVTMPTVNIKQVSSF